MKDCEIQAIEQNFTQCFEILPRPSVASGQGDDDPVLSALRRYRDAAGSTFHPLSEARTEGLTVMSSFPGCFRSIKYEEV